MLREQQSSEETATPPAEIEAAGLIYVSDSTKGISRRNLGRAFAYFSSSGEVIRDPATLKRIRSLVIPPAWSDVWICPRAKGHIQATGRDARGR
jgi:DNA topoisomerase-1